MAKGYDKHRERLEAIQALGRPLARRAASACELCAAAGVPLQTLEVPPLPQEPEFERCVMLCARCAAGVQGGPLDATSWRFLETAMWAEIPAVQVLAVRSLRRLAPQASWAQDALDMLYLDDEVRAWADEG